MTLSAWGSGSGHGSSVTGTRTRSITLPSRGLREKTSTNALVSDITRKEIGNAYVPNSGAPSDAVAKSFASSRPAASTSRQATAASKTLARPATAIGVVTRAPVSGRSTARLPPLETSGLGAGEGEAVGVGDGVNEAPALGAVLGLAVGASVAGLEVSVTTVPDAQTASVSEHAMAKPRRLTSPR